MAEEQGFGLEKSLKREAKKLGLPLPNFSMEGDYLVVTIYRNKNAAVTTLPEEVRNYLSSAELVGWKWLARQQTVTSSEYTKAMSVPKRTALNHLKHFVELGLVRKQGSARSTRYEVNRS